MAVKYVLFCSDFFCRKKRHYFEKNVLVFFKTGRKLLCYLHSNWLSLSQFVFFNQKNVNHEFSKFKKFIFFFFGFRKLKFYPKKNKSVFCFLAFIDSSSTES